MITTSLLPIRQSKGFRITRCNLSDYSNNYNDKIMPIQNYKKIDMAVLQGVVVAPILIYDFPGFWAQVLDKEGHIVKGPRKKKVLISSLTVSANVSIKWKCHDGKWPNGDYADDHEWKAAPYSRWNREEKKVRKCPFCPGKGRRRVCKSNSLGALNSKLVNEWHSDNDITPFDVLPFSHEKVKWKCHDGKLPNGDYADDHVWPAMVSDRSRGKGCPFCYGDAVCESNCLPTTHPELVKEWHPDNEYPASNYKAGSSISYVPKWKCYDGEWPNGNYANDHEWKVRIVNRTRGSGCPYCLNASDSRSRVCDSNSLVATHPSLAKLWSLKNPKTPNQVLGGTNDKYLWNCAKDPNHEYRQSPKSKTTQNAGCKSCKLKNETKVYDYCKEIFPHLAEEGIIRNQKKLFEKNPLMELDIWIPNLNVGIEYQGEQHYIARIDWPNGQELLKQNQKRDEQKRFWCGELGIHLIEIKYDWKMDKKVLVDKLNGYI
jgi:hypothetical protein